jgi:hypothetical protein
VSSFWRSDVFLSAPTGVGGTFDLTYVDAVTGETVVKHGSVSRRQAVLLDDVIGNYFGRFGFGTVRADLSGALVATSRTFTTSNDGTYGQFIPLTHLGVLDGVVTDVFFGPREVLQVERSAAFRTNIGAINTTDGNEVIRFTLFDTGGRALGSTDRTIGPLRAVQFSLDSLTSSPVVNGRVEVQVLAGAGRALAWASIVDNITGDPIFVPAQ